MEIINKSKATPVVLEVILNSTHDAMIAVDTDGVITLYNKAAAELTGKNIDDVLGKRLDEVVPTTRLPYILKTGVSELNQRQRLGEIDIITNRMPVRDANGAIIGAVAVFRDISELMGLAEEITNLRELRTTLEAIINSTDDAISVVDENGVNVLINDSYKRITGFSREEIIGKSASYDIAEGESIHLKVLRELSPIRNARLKVGPKRVEVVVNAMPLIVDGELKGSVGVMKDISEVKKLSDELSVAKQIIRKLEAKYTFEDIVGKSKPILEAIEKSKKAAHTPATVLLRGESGTGKELFAHAIHNESNRKYGQFVRVNCAALAESILESELFGYKEGAFTGAQKGGHKGLFEEANGGTIFLDEIGDISPSTQVKLLRVIQEREVLRLGSSKPIPIDVRIITATNRDLEKAIPIGKFREDLYYRLNVIPINIAPLRDRQEDIYAMVIHILKKFSLEYGRMVVDVSDRVLTTLQSYHWPGNVRELENFLGRSIINMQPTESVVRSHHIPSFESGQRGRTVKGFSVDESLKSYLERSEREHIIECLEKYEGNRTKAAKVLGISPRSLFYKLSKYDIV